MTISQAKHSIANMTFELAAHIQGKIAATRAEYAKRHAFSRRSAAPISLHPHNSGCNIPTGQNTSSLGSRSKTAPSGALSSPK
jgi:hypothetical protein